MVRTSASFLLGVFGRYIISFLLDGVNSGEATLSIIHRLFQCSLLCHPQASLRPLLKAFFQACRLAFHLSIAMPSSIAALSFLPGRV